MAWIAERKDVLSTLFGLLAIWLYVGYVGEPRWTRSDVVPGQPAEMEVPAPDGTAVRFVAELFSAGRWCKAADALATAQGGVARAQITVGAEWEGALRFRVEAVDPGPNQVRFRARLLGNGNG